MKRNQIFLLISAFIAFSLLGLLIADQINIIFSSKDSSIPITTNHIQQRNFLLLYVDDLTKPNPELVSVWALFTVLSDPPYLTIKALYPNPSDSKQERSLDGLFSISPQGKPTEKFINKLNTFDFHWDNYILLDNHAVMFLYEWCLNNHEHINNHSLPKAHDMKSPLLKDEIVLFEIICDQLPFNGKKVIKPEWNKLIPEHMLTDLLFDTTVIYWNNLSSTNHPPYCEIITKQ